MQDFFHQQYYLTCWWLFVNRNLLLNPINNKTSKPQCIKPIPQKDYFPVICGHPFLSMRCNFQPQILFRSGWNTYTFTLPCIQKLQSMVHLSSFGWFYPARPSCCCWPVASYPPKCWSRDICVMAKKAQQTFESVEFFNDGHLDFMIDHNLYWRDPKQSSLATVFWTGRPPESLMEK